MNILNHKKTILIIIATLIAFFGYWYLFINQKDTSKQDTNQIKSSSAKLNTLTTNNLYSKEFVSSLVGFNSVKLDISIFELNEYKALNYPEKPFDINYSKESGRDNPFLPIGTEGRSSINSLQTQDKTKTISNETDLTSKLSTTTSTTASTTTKPKPIQKTFQ